MYKKIYNIWWNIDYFFLHNDQIVQFNNRMFQSFIVRRISEYIYRHLDLIFLFFSHESWIIEEISSLSSRKKCIKRYIIYNEISIIFFTQWFNSTIESSSNRVFIVRRISEYIYRHLDLIFLSFSHESWVMEEINSRRSSYLGVNKGWIWKFSIQMRYHSGRRYVRMHERVACRFNPCTCFARGDLSLQFASLNIIISRNTHRRIACS